MQKSQSVAAAQNKNPGHSTFIVALSLLLALSSLLVFAVSRSAVHSFHFTFYAILSFLPLTVNVWLVLLIMRLRAQSEETVWFVLYLCGLSIACLGEGLQRMSLQMDGALFWYHLNSIGYAIMPMAYYLFALAYVKPLRYQSALLLPALVTCAGLIIFFFSSTDLFFSFHADKELWGYNTPTEPAFPILLVWIEVPLIAALVTLVRFRRTVTSDLLRRQARVYIWALLVPLVGGTITDGIMPAFGFNDIVPTSLFLSTCTSVIAYIGLRKYRSFQANPTVFAGDVIAGMQEAVIVTDVHHVINFMNPEAERLMGTKYAALTKKNLQNRFDGPSWDMIMQGITTGLPESDGAEPDRLQFMNDSGTTIPVSVYASRLDPDSPAEMRIFIITDNSDLAASYRQLKDNAARIASQNDQLQENQTTMARLLNEAKSLQKQLEHEKESVEHTVEVRTTELREARDKLAASDQLKSEFIMLSSHNLRTPLSIMRSSVELLAGNPNTLTDQQRQMVDSLASSTARLGEFIEDLLAIATLEAGDELSLVPMPLADLVAPLTDETAALAKSKNLEFDAPDIDPAIRVNANALRLRGAIRNVLHNAVNFTESGSVHFSVALDGAKVRLVIADTGIGIKPDEMPRLFTKFHRATDTLAYNYSGEGIGLYLAKLVVEEHGGTITAESTYGQGSTFRIELPVLQSSAVPA